MEPTEAAIRSAEIKASGGNPIIWFETRNIKPNTFICVVDGQGFEGPWNEIVAAGFLEKPGVVVLCNPITKAQLDAAIKKSQRKFKPGEAVPGVQNVYTPPVRVSFPNLKRPGQTGNEGRTVGARPELGMPYMPNQVGDGLSGAPYDVIMDEAGNVTPAPTREQLADLETAARIIGYAKTGPTDGS